MHRTLALAFASLAALAPTAAHADIAGDRVLLVIGATGCPANQTGFKRVYQSPDGSQANDLAEFQVPSGRYLEITSIEYTTPASAFASQWVQSFDVNVRQRSGTQQTNILSVSFSNAPDIDGSGNEIGTFTSRGLESTVASFPSGPLMSNLGRLCMSAPSTFFNLGGRLRIRGRLIAADPTSLPPGGGGALP